MEHELVSVGEGRKAEEEEIQGDEKDEEDEKRGEEEVEEAQEACEKIQDKLPVNEQRSPI